MNNSQLIKKRLVQLKKMSVQLKQSTENHNQVDYGLIQGILQATKSSAISQSQNQQMYYSKTSKKSDRQSPLSKLLSFTVPQNPHDNGNYNQQYTPLFPQNNINTKKQSKRALFESKSNNQIHHRPFEQSGVHSHQAYFSREQNTNTNSNYQTQPHNSYQQSLNINNNSNEQEIISLREENTELQKKLMNLRLCVDSLKQKNIKLEEQTWKQGLPFFKLSQKIEGFYTKLKVSEKDYEKIDYHSYNCQLTLDKLCVNKQVGSLASTKQLFLACLLEVHYIQSTVMLLQFGEINNEQDNQNLFVKFENEEDLHRWDIALYINFQIIDSLKKQKLFNNSNSFNINLKEKDRKLSSQSRKRSSDSYKKSNKSNDLQYKDQKDLISKLVERRDLYLQAKKLVSEKMIEKIHAKKGKTEQLKEQINVDEQSQTTPYQIKQNSLNRNLFDTFLNSNQQKQQQLGQKKQQRFNTSKFKQIHQIPPLALQDKGMSFNQNNYQLDLGKKLQQDKQRQIERLRIQNIQKEQQDKKKYQQIINRITKIGFRLTKYSKDGFNPHNKKVYVSENLQNLCWEEESGGDLKSIPLDSIKQVIYQKIGQGIRKHVKKPKKQEFCNISYITSDKKNKVIELGGVAEQTSQFVDQLICVIQHKKQQNK